MKRPLLLLLAAAGLAPPTRAQLPYQTVPTGALRIELGGAFLPVTQEFADGDLRRLGDPIAASPLFGTTLASRLTALLGRPASGGTSGTLTADLMQQRGIGTIGLGVGVSSRLSLSARIPIVSIRTEWAVDHDGEGATLGLNPALRGDPGSQLFADQFDAALGLLRTRRDAGDYASDPALQALADAVLADAPVWRARFVATVVTPSTAELALPLALSPDGSELLAQATAWRDQLTGPLGIEGFTALPTLPVAPVTTEDIAALLTGASGFGLLPPDEIPLVALGDVELEANYLLVARHDSSTRRWFGAWLQGGVTAPTGTPPRHDRLRDLGTGDGQMDVTLGAVVEVGSGRFGLRAEGRYRRQMEGERVARVADRDEFLVPVTRVATLRWDPGDEVTVTAQPFVRLADRLALSGSLTWWQRGRDAWRAESGDPDSEVTRMGDGTAANALRLGAGLAYAHAGTHVDGVTRMPVEAGLSLERTVASGEGLVARPLTTRLWFRVYARLW